MIFLNIYPTSTLETIIEKGELFPFINLRNIDYLMMSKIYSEIVNGEIISEEDLNNEDVKTEMDIETPYWVGDKISNSNCKIAIKDRDNNIKVSKAFVGYPYIKLLIKVKE